jgi:hypothetical protein
LRNASVGHAALGSATDTTSNANVTRLFMYGTLSWDRFRMAIHSSLVGAVAPERIPGGH